MKIVDFLLEQEPNEEIRNTLNQIRDYPELCNILDSYYRKLKNCFHNEAFQKYFKSNIKEAVFSTFPLLSEEIAIINNPDLSRNCCRILIRLHQNIFDEHLNDQKTFKYVLNQALNSFRIFRASTDDDFINLFMKWKRQHKNLLLLMLTIVDTNCLVWTGSENEYFRFKIIMKRLLWFDENFNIDKFFNNHKSKIVFNCKKNYLRHLAFFLHELHEHKLINSEVLNEYMKVAVRLFTYDGKEVKLGRMHKLNSETLANKDKYKYITHTINVLIDEILNIKKEEI